MTSTPDISVVVCTYERPRNLALCLASVGAQAGVDGRIELIVADDGSTDETADVVAAFAREAPFPVRFTTHEHRGFHPARCRNDGAREGTAPYLLFLDGDCVIPPDHVGTHLELRRPGTVCGSDSFRLTEEQSLQVERGRLSFAGLTRLAPFRERIRVGRDHLDAKLNWLLRNPSKPKLFAGNIGIWRQDLERVNGFDEQFRDWGGEDDDLRQRLIQAGITVRSIRERARSFHLWHAPDATVPDTWRECRNAPLLHRRFRLTRCFDGLEKRRLDDLSIRVRNAARFESLIDALFPFARRFARPEEHADIECLILPGDEGFSGSADCRLLVLTERVARAPLADAHVLVTDLGDVRFDSGPRLRTSECSRVLESIL